MAPKMSRRKKYQIPSGPSRSQRSRGASKRGGPDRAQCCDASSPLAYHPTTPISSALDASRFANMGRGLAWKLEKQCLNSECVCCLESSLRMLVASIMTPGRSTSKCPSSACASGRHGHQASTREEEASLLMNSKTETKTKPKPQRTPVQHAGRAGMRDEGTRPRIGVVVGGVCTTDTRKCPCRNAEPLLVKCKDGAHVENDGLRGIKVARQTAAPAIAPVNLGAIGGKQY